MKKIMVRFNTENKGTLCWRAIIDGVEHLANSINFKVEVFTTKDELPGGITKWHISAYYNNLSWDGDNNLTVY